MILGEGHVGEDIILGLLHERGGFLGADLESSDEFAPLFASLLLCCLIEGAAQGGGNHWPVLLADPLERIAHEVYAAALPGSAKDLGNGRFQAFMGVGNDELDAA